jgi:hypothetical protein
LAYGKPITSTFADSIASPIAAAFLASIRASTHFFASVSVSKRPVVPDFQR